jgi:hypothetical protein
MDRIAKKMLLFGTELILAAIVLPTCLAVGQSLLLDFGVLHALPDPKQEAVKEIAWYMTLIWLGGGIVAVGFLSIILGVILVVVSLRRRETDEDITDIK